MTRSNSHFSDWLVPGWPAPEGVRALCTTRHGGVSAAPYDGLNLGDHVGDDAALVEQNRALLHRELTARPVYMRQVHGTQILELGSDTQDHAPADGAFTTRQGLACTVMVADCLPVLLCDARGSMVAAVHAGWRGLVGVDGWGILEETHRRFLSLAPVEYGNKAIELIAWLGPCIGPQAFEVGFDVVAAFTRIAPQTADCFKPLSQGKWLADLPALARQRLQGLGISQVFGNDGSADWCTVGNPLRFFSHRRDRVSGRQAACIWLD